MKNKKFLFILLPLVVVVWGMIAYQITEALEAPVSAASSSLGSSDVKEKKVTDQDTFKLLLGYSDPFLSKRPKKESDSELSLTASITENVIKYSSPSSLSRQVQPDIVTWPLVEYLGLIEHHTKKRRIAILRIDGENFLIGEGEMAKKVNLVLILQDSVLLGYKTEKKYVSK